MTTEKKYFAFISYQRNDEEWAKWLADQLEHFHLPLTLNGRDDLPKDLRPIFRDIDELAAGNLPQQIHQALNSSKNLIVVCSPNSAKSSWVNKEVEMFIGMGKLDNIFPFIIDGVAFSKNEDEECLPEALRKLSDDKERLGANVKDYKDGPQRPCKDCPLPKDNSDDKNQGNINEKGRDAAVVKIIAGMLGIGFDTLWQRYEKEKAEEERKIKEQRDKLLIAQSRFLAEKAEKLIDEGDSYLARLLALEILPKNLKDPDRPYTPEAEHVLRKAIKNETGVFKGHKDCVRSAVFSPDNSNVISVSDDSTIKIWGTYSGRVEKTITDHTDTILSICYNKEKILFATASVDKNVIIRDSQTYNVKAIIPHPTSVYYAAFSPNGNYVVTASADSIVRIWDWNNTKKPIRELIGHTDAVRVASFSPDNTHIVTGSDDFTIRVWDLTKKDSDACIKSIELKKYCIVRCVDYNKKGDIIICTADTNVYLLDVNDDYNLLCPPLKNKGGAWWACFSPNEKTIATTSFNDVCFWEFDKEEKKCQLIKVLKGHSAQIIHLSFSDDGNRLLSNSEDETIRLWDISKRKGIIEYQSSVASVALFPKTDIAVATSCIEQTRLLSISNGETLKTEEQSWSRILHDYNDNFVFVDSEGNTVYKSNGLRVLRFNATNLKPKMYPIDMQTPLLFYPEAYAVHFMTISPNGGLALTAFKEGVMILWNTENGRIIKEFDETQNRNRRSLCGAFDPSSTIVATLAWEKAVQLWDSITGEFVKELEMPHHYWGNSAQFSSDGKLLVSASQNNMVHIWNVETGKLIHNEINNYTFDDRVLYAEFSQDKKYIVTTTAKGTISIFETSTGMLIDAFDIHDSNTPFSRKAMFSIDSKNILVLADNGCTDKSIMKVIPFCPLEDLVKKTRGYFKNRMLTDSEKRKYYLESLVSIKKC